MCRSLCVYVCDIFIEEIRIFFWEYYTQIHNMYIICRILERNNQRVLRFMSRKYNINEWGLVCRYTFLLGQVANL